MKNFIIRTIVFIFFVVMIGILMNKDLVITIFRPAGDLFLNYNEKIYSKDIVSLQNATLLSGNKLLDTSTLGEKEIEIRYKNKREIFVYIIKYTVVDKVPPLIMGTATHTFKKGDTVDLVDTMLCGDNYDKRPICYLEGAYDINKVGEYNLKYIAIDSSNNRAEKDYKLIVKNNIDNRSDSSVVESLPIEEVISKHKNENTMIGIDVSSWQGEINWGKVKASGVEFAMIRIAYGYNNENEIIYDSRFKENLKNAKEAGIKVGLYFYTYARNEEEAKNQAKWIVNALDGELLDLPIAFDWEIWSKFNSYNISFTDLNSIAVSFMQELENYDYRGMIYGSCSYLERIWDLKEYKTWLAHYTSQTDYTKEYYIWQFSNTGKVNGINGYVDIDILYKK